MSSVLLEVAELLAATARRVNPTREVRVIDATEHPMQEGGWPEAVMSIEIRQRYREGDTPGYHDFVAVQAMPDGIHGHNGEPHERNRLIAEWEDPDLERKVAQAITELGRVYELPPFPTDWLELDERQSAERSFEVNIR